MGLIIPFSVHSGVNGFADVTVGRSTGKQRGGSL